MIVKPGIAGLTKENAAPEATGNGVKSDGKAAKLPRKHTPKPHRKAMGKRARHHVVCQMLCVPLWHDTESAWLYFSGFIMTRLTAKERAGLANAALRSLDDEPTYQAATLALFGIVDGKVAR